MYTYLVLVLVLVPLALMLVVVLMLVLVLVRCSGHNSTTPKAGPKVRHRHHLPSAAGPSSGAVIGRPRPRAPPAKPAA